MISLAVAAGGAIGALLRYWAASWNSVAHLPYGTLLVNLFGSYLIGVSYFLFLQSNLSPATKLFIQTGIIGSLTTYSTLNLELVLYLTNGEYSRFTIYFLLNAGMGIAAVFAGMWSVRWLT